MVTATEFMKTLAAEFYPALRADGFRGSGRTLRRRLSDVVHVLDIQGSAADRCYVNLGIHLSFLPGAGSTSTGGCDPRAIRASECMMRMRLQPSPEFQFGFPYGTTPDETARSIEKLRTAYQVEGAVFFRRFSAFPDDFLKITPQAVREGSSPLGALVCARIAFHLADAALAREFAQVGYDMVTAKSGERAAEYFRRILANPDPPAYWTGMCPAPEWDRGPGK